MSDKLTDWSQPILVPAAGLEPERPAPADHAIVLPPDLHTKVLRVLISEAQLQRRIDALAAAIAASYPPGGELVVAPVLTGAFVFAADLGRALAGSMRSDVRYEFLKARTYGDEVRGDTDAQPANTRKVAIDLLPDDVAGRHVLLIDDIIDQGFTLGYVRNLVAAWNVASLKVCVLLDKQLSRPSTDARELRKHVAPDWVGFLVPDVWVAGYGLDAAGELRHLPCIVSVDADRYSD